MSAQKLDDKEVEALLRSGWSQVAIVDMYHERGIDITQSAISQAIASGRIKVDTNVNTGAIPWVLKPAHRHFHAARMLRTQARLDKGMEIGPSLKRQVETWVEGLELEDSVIHYDPDTQEGFWRVPRRNGIDLWWVRDPGVDDAGLPVQRKRNPRHGGGRAAAAFAFLLAGLLSSLLDPMSSLVT